MGLSFIGEVGTTIVDSLCAINLVLSTTALVQG